MGLGASGRETHGLGNAASWLKTQGVGDNHTCPTSPWSKTQDVRDAQISPHKSLVENLGVGMLR